MKKLSLSFAVSIACLICFCSPLSAQITAVWQGGKPGMATDWNCAANWKEGRVPNEFCQVVIPADVQNYPVIEKPVAPIDALLVESNATLTIRQGAVLNILGATGCFEGLMLFGHVSNQGTLQVSGSINPGMASLEHLDGPGSLVVMDTSVAQR